jgi:plasmid stabilization system protein ParE
MPAALRRSPPAVADITRAAEWYDDQQPGLGDEFVSEVNAVIKSLADNPYLHAIRFADVRCARLKRFRKYGIYYFSWHDEVIVLSVFHGSQHPRRLWQKWREVR